MTFLHCLHSLRLFHLSLHTRAYREKGGESPNCRNRAHNPRYWSGNAGSGFRRFQARRYALHTYLDPKVNLVGTTRVGEGGRQR